VSGSTLNALFEAGGSFAIIKRKGSQVGIPLTETTRATSMCGTPGHPGYGRTHADCEREVRRLERAGGAGQWLAAVTHDHRAAGGKDRGWGFR
jgi:hypothetical protein